jgi:4-amino-4-deoxy-L-arabinose transferase-like glycosyltransferase
VALLTRLPLLSISLDEVDAANFVNALANGYNIPQFRPHAPGYPVYIFLGWLLNQAIGNPLLTLTLLSALLGSLAVFPFYLLLRELAGPRIALVGSLLFIVNPLFWSFSEAALSDVPAMFLAVLLAWLCYRARHSTAAFLWACVVLSIAIGTRPPNVALVLLLAFPLGYRWLVGKNLSWKLPILGVGLFAIATLAWALPMVFMGSAGFADYTAAASRQWATAVTIYDFTHVESPRLVNILLRIERFFYGYFLTFPWTGDDAKTPISLLLVVPWLFGFALYVASFSFRSAPHVLTALWIASIGYAIFAIHFLPRYGLAPMAGFMMACLLGYRFLGSSLLSHPRRLEVLSMMGIGCVLILYAIKYQPSLATFEFTPPAGSLFGGILFVAGTLVLLLARLVYRPAGPERQSSDRERGWLPGTASGNVATLVIVGLALLIVPFAVKGYSLASIAHKYPNPNQQMVEYVKANFDIARITPCWDNQTHSFFEALIPNAVPTGYWSIDHLYGAYNAGNILLVTDRCTWRVQLDRTLGLVEVGQFKGNSPLWAKAPTIRLYATKRPR